MILCDTGPVVAIVDRSDANHSRCVEAMGTLPAEPLITRWPCLTESMYLLWRCGGTEAQEELWGLIADGLAALHNPDDNEWQRCRELMKKYSDLPMDFADASLVTAAESLGLRRVFTLDSHYSIYRIHRKEPFELVP